MGEAIAGGGLRWLGFVIGGWDVVVYLEDEDGVDEKVLFSVAESQDHRRSILGLCIITELER